MGINAHNGMVGLFVEISAQLWFCFCFVNLNLLYGVL